MIDAVRWVSQIQQGQTISQPVVQYVKASVAAHLFVCVGKDKESFWIGKGIIHFFHITDYFFIVLVYQPSFFLISEPANQINQQLRQEFFLWSFCSHNGDRERQRKVSKSLRQIEWTSLHKINNGNVSDNTFFCFFKCKVNQNRHYFCCFLKNYWPRCRKKCRFRRILRKVL